MENEVAFIISELKAASSPSNLEGQARFGIDTRYSLGVSIPKLRKLTKKYRKQHVLALRLWETEIHEGRILASMIDDPALVTKTQMDSWVRDFYSWDLCDQVCGNLFDKTPYAFGKAKEWAGDESEFVRRAGFVMMATLSVHNKKADDKLFLEFFPLIEKYSSDDRNFVKKAVNWALRQIGKRNTELHTEAINLAKKIAAQDSKHGKWIATNALKELESKKIIDKLRRKEVFKNN